MRVAFYAPMKPPDHPVPSGDRRMARLLIEALERAGHRVEIASRFRSWEGRGDALRQTRLSRAGQGLAERLLRRYRSGPDSARPTAWLTYHLYYKAPDWIGPRVAEALGIPYLVAEASVAPKRAGGPWDPGHRATLAALGAAKAVLNLNPADLDCLPPGCPVYPLAPFLDARPHRAAFAARAAQRTALAETRALDPSVPWILAVAMMRQKDKLRSYEILAEALAGLTDSPWQLVIVGDGPARAAVEATFAGFPADRVRFLGEQPEDRLPSLLAAADLFAWPAVNEAYGMALLEAQAAGLPAVAGAWGGVPSLLADGVTGLLAAPGDSRAFAAALERLLRDPERRRNMAEAAVRRVEETHGLQAAAARLDEILREVRTGHDTAA